MTRLDDALITRLANAKAPHAYSHEVKAMATEIAERRAADAKASTPNPAQASGNTPWTQGIPYP